MCYRVKGYTDRHRVAVLCFAGNILNRSINQIISGQLIEIAHTATYQTLKNEFGVLKVKSLKGGLDFTQLTNEEIDLQLTKYFRTHPFMRRYDFQYLCGMARSTAMRHIRRLRDEGKLKNMGGAMQPIYVPESGYYGNNE